MENRTPEKRKGRIWTIIGTTISLLYLGFNAYDYLKPKILSFRVESSLRQYEPDITRCVKEKQKELGDKKVFGLEYSCAIDIASSFYSTDPEKAIQLCMAYNPVVKVQPGRKYNPLGSQKEIEARADEAVARTACKGSIKQRLKEVSTEVKNTVTEKSESASVVENIQVNQGVGIRGEIVVDLPTKYAISKQNTSVAPGSYLYKITRTDSTPDEASWQVFIVPLQAVQQLDKNCAPGDCMRDTSIFPRENFFLADLKAVSGGSTPGLKLLNGQNFIISTVPVDGDTGFSRNYITYINDTRVVFTAWAETRADAESHDNFISMVKIRDVK